MHAAALFLLALSCLGLLGQEGLPITFRQWMGGKEVGGSRRETQRKGSGLEVRSREWLVLSRQGEEIRQEVVETAGRAPTGELSFTWRLQLSSEPFEGRAEWSPKAPEVLILRPTNGPELRKPVPTGAVLWPEDLEASLKAAAQARRGIQATTFSFPVQQWNTLQIEPRGASPLPGFPDAVRFTGEERQGAATIPVEVWISPTAGELRHRTEWGGIEVLTQRSELPEPTPGDKPANGIFERTLQKLPPHPFQPWIRTMVLRAEGSAPELPEDAQQARLPGNRLRLVRAASPSAAEAAQPPVTGAPDPEEVRYLASSPLVPFQDPAFDGLLHRMALPPGLSRWNLARRVNAFVFDWITEKDYSVGFASALEVCHLPRGDCTEHGVLAVALLRRLGVPARGVTGWVGLGDTLGLHFWVEIRLKGRWVPMDPTFDQPLASAFRIKLGDTDLSDLGSVGWETAAFVFSGVRWVPEREQGRPWGDIVTMTGDRIEAPGGLQLRLPGARWEVRKGVLTLRTRQGGPWRLQAVTRPGDAQLRGAVRMAGARSHRHGWWLAGSGQLWMELGEGRWLLLESVPEADAYGLLDQLLLAASSS